MSAELIPIDVEVGLAVDDPTSEVARTSWGETIPATHVKWRADLLVPGVVVSVTAFASVTHQNRSWFDPRFFVAQGLNSSPPPTWVPSAPSWFWAVVACMAAEHEATIGVRA